MIYPIPKPLALVQHMLVLAQMSSLTVLMVSILSSHRACGLTLLEATSRTWSSAAVTSISGSACCQVEEWYNSSASNVPESHVNHAWLFTYGPSMFDGLLGALDIRPSLEVPVVTFGRELRFNSLPSEEPPIVQARVEKSERPDACVHGMAYFITASELSNYSAAQGPHYQQTIMEVTTYVGQKLEAVGLVEDVPPVESEDVMPMYGYAKAMVCGARQHGICPGYKDWLTDHLTSLGSPTKMFDC
mmetsp:Transcript_13064/g.32613  ORF Transcript_13064/g.32613 Transcript_13064/m.32613 type:complete len:245 (-) Transcript_13064:21-755(-)